MSKLAIAYAMKKKKKMDKFERREKNPKEDSSAFPSEHAKGVHQESYSHPESKSQVGNTYENAKYYDPGRKAYGHVMAEHKSKLDELKKINPKLKGLADGGEVKPTSTPSPIDPDKAKLFMAGFKGQKKAHGGFIAEEKSSGYEKMPQEHEMHNGPAHEEDDKDLNQQPVDMHSETSVAMQGLVDRIMDKKSKEFDNCARLSHGGQVANDTGNGQAADEMPNQFDDLVLDDALESHYGDDDNSGDALGNAQENEDRHDIVARIMASRKKKDKNPSPA